MLTILANAHRDQKKKRDPYEPKDFLDWPELEEVDERIPIKVSDMKSIFIRPNGEPRKEAGKK